MTLNLNKAILAGNVGADPEIRMTKDGKKVATFNIAYNEKYGDKKITSWHKIVAFGKIVDNIIEPYVKKGSSLYIEGKIVNRSWEDSNGNKRTTTEIVLGGYESVIKLNGGTKEKTSTEYSVNNTYENNSNVLDDEIPF